jgi:YD repeat-containing protein
VTGAVCKNATGTTAPGFDFGYAYDSMGNRTSETSSGSVATYYQGNTGSGPVGGNALNQYGSRGVPRQVDVAGLADAATTVTVNGQATQRLGEHWFKRLNYSGDAAQWLGISVSGGGNYYSSGNILLKGHPEVYAYDDDGNLLNDGRWTARDERTESGRPKMIPRCARKQEARRRAVLS